MAKHAHTTTALSVEPDRRARYEAALADLDAFAQLQASLVPKPQFPAVYSVVPHGHCMEPLYKHGVPLIISSTAKCEEGDVVIVHLKPEAQARWGFEAIVKRLRWGLYGMTFPWDATGSDIILPIALEQLNPPRSFDVPATHIRAIHKVLGCGERAGDGQVKAPRKMVEAV